MNLFTLSIIIPSYNEEKTILSVLDSVFSVDLVFAVKKEVIVVNDGSTDDTERKVRRYVDSHKDYNIKYISSRCNKGKGAAIRKALLEVSGDYVIIQDADLEYDPGDYNIILKTLIDEDREVVYGSRFLIHENRHSYRSFYIGGRIVSFFTNILYGQKLTDEPTCYKIFRTSLLKSLALRCERFEFCPEVTAKVSKLGIKIKEVPIHYYPRTIENGKKIKWSDGLEALWTLLKYRFYD